MPHRNIRYRLYPLTRTKANLLNQCLGATRFVWNHFLGENQKLMRAHELDQSLPRPETSFFSLGKCFTELRKQTEWLKTLPYAPIRYILKYQADAWQQFFKSKKGYPKFKSKFYHDDSVTFPEGSFKLNGTSLHLQRIGQVVLSGSNPYEGCNTKQVVIKREEDKFYATVCYEVSEGLIQVTDNGQALGIDMNVGQFATSEGEIKHLPDVKTLEAKRNRYQRRMARQQRPIHKQGIKPSNRYLKTRKRAKKAARKIRNIRSNWHHQESRAIANDYQYAVVEDLHTQIMTKSAKGTVEEPGVNVAAKSGLNREILNTGWYGLKQKLAYKTEVIEVSAINTSRRCHACGHIDADNRRSQAVFRCVVCDHSDNADVNAALNIKALGTRAIGRGRGDYLGNLDDPSREYAFT